MINHLSTSIIGLLGKSDEILANFFEADPKEIRASLNERLAKGENFIGSVNCIGFDPVTGKCPGHEARKKLPIKAAIIVRKLEERKAESNLYTPRAMGAMAAFQEAINLINEMYKDEMVYE